MKYIGAAYVFYLDSVTSQWSCHSKLTPADPTTDCAFGMSSAIQDSTLVIGAYTCWAGSVKSGINFLLFH